MSSIKTLCGSVKSEFYRIIISPKTYFSVICIVIVLLLNAQMNGIYEVNDTVYYLMIALAENMNLILILCVTLSFSTLFLDDWKRKYVLLAIERTGTKNYAAAKVIACFIGSWFVSFAGIHIFLGLLSLKIPFIGEQYEGNLWSGYSDLAASDFPYLYVLLVVSVLAAGYAFWAVVGVLISSYFTNIFMTVGLTVIMAYYILTMTTPICPYMINIGIIGFARDLGLGVFGNFFYSIAFFLLLSGFAGFLFCRRMKRRVSGEIH